MEDTYGIQSRIGSIIVVERWYCCRGSPVFSDRNIHYYVLMTDYAKFMIPEVYKSLCRLYTESIYEDLPEFFEVDERFEKIYRNKGGI